MSTINTTVSGGVTIGVDVTSPLTITANGAVTSSNGVAVAGAYGVIVNSGIIAGVVGVQLGSGADRITLASGGTIVGTGGTAVSFGDGADTLLLGPGAVAITGTVDGGAGTDGFAVGAGTTTLTGSNAQFVNFETGSVAAGSTLVTTGTVGFGAGLGVDVAGSLVNSGTLLAGNAFGLYVSGGSLRNEATGVIRGTAAPTGGAAVVFDSSSPASTLTNLGSIDGGANFGVLLLGSGSLGNSGSINSIFADGFNTATATITNTGTIGSIRGFDEVMTVVNSGLLGSVYISQNNTSTLSNSGTVSGTFGVQFQDGFGRVGNSGLITGTNGSGVIFDAGGTLSNAAGGRITGTGANAGVTISGGAGTVSNAGTISGATGVSFTGNFADRLTLASGGTIIGTGGTAVSFGDGADTLLLGPGAVAITGTVDGGAGTDSFTVGAGTTTLTGTGATFINLESGTILSGGTLALLGSASLGTGTTLSVAGVLNNAGTLTVATATGLQLAGGGQVRNEATGTITGTAATVAGGGAVVAGGGTSTVENLGTIAGGSNVGVQMNGASALTITNSGLVSSSYAGIRSASGTLTVTNTSTGTITASGGSGRGVQASGILQLLNEGTVTGTLVGAFQAGGGTVTNTGLISGARGVYANGVASNVVNSGTIFGDPFFGVGMRLGGAVTNQAGGLISGTGLNAGVTISGGAGTVTNAGIIAGGDAGTGIAFSGAFADTVTLADGGTVIGPGGTAVFFGDGADTLTLGPGAVAITGTVNGGAGTDTLVVGAGATTLTGTNAAFVGFENGTIAVGGTLAVLGTASFGAGLTLTSSGTLDVRGVVANAGTVFGDGYAAVRVTGGTLRNEVGGRIVQLGVVGGLNPGVIVTGAGTVVNLGTIESDNVGIRLSGDGTVINGSAAVPGATVYGGDVGISSNGGTLTLTNLGTIATTGSGTVSGIVTGDATITNGAADVTTARIASYSIGIVANAAATITNFGTISAIYAGVELRGASAVTNEGLISGGSGFGGFGFGIRAQGSASGTILNEGTIAGVTGVGVAATNVTVVNGGTITGTGGTAVTLSGTGNVLKLLPGQVMDGLANGGGGATLELGAGTGALSGLGTQYVDFAALRVDAGGNWTLGTTATYAGAVYNDGALVVQAGLALTLSGALAADPGGVGRITVTGTGVLTLSGAVAATQVLDLSGTGGLLVLNAPAAMASTVAGFGVGDTVDLRGIGTATAASLGAGNVLTLSGGSGGPISIQLDPAASYAGFGFAVAADGAGGTNVRVDTTPTIGGTAAGQAVADDGTLAPFSAVTLADPDPGASETVTVTYAAANGVLGNLGGFTGSAGSYTFTGTVAAAQAALRGLVFNPTDNQVAPGTTVTTAFTLTVSDGTSTATNATTTVVATSADDAPAIGGAVAAQATTDKAAMSPFAGITVADPDVGASESVTITVTAGGAATDANGTLSGTGLTKVGVGTYGLAAGAPGDVQAALRGLLFTPTENGAAPGATVTTGFTVSVSDGTETTTNATTTVVATSVNDAPVIGGTVAGQATTDKAAVSPFAAVTLADPDPGTSVTATVTLSVAGEGELSNPSDGTLSGATYTVSGTPAAVQASLRALVFTPRENQVSPGQTVTTGFTLSVTDGTATATDDTTTVVATSVNDPPTVLVDVDPRANRIVEGNGGGGGLVGVILSATDPDVGTMLRYSLDDSAGGRFVVNQRFGDVRTSGLVALDYETAPGHAYTIVGTVSDGALSRSAAFTIAVADAVPAGVTLAVSGTADGVVNAAEARAVSVAVAGLDSGDTGVATFTDGGRAVSAAVSGNGALTVDLSGLNGTVTSSVAVRNGSGTGAASFAGNSVAFDTLAPGAPFAPDLLAASDSGASATDNLTNLRTPTLAGVAEAGATVVLYDTDGVTVLGSAVAGAGGAWSITSAALVEGAHTLTARATDAAGNVSAPSSGLTVVVDTLAPPVAVTAAGGAPSRASQVVGGTLGAADAGETVVLREGATVLGAAVADAAGGWSIGFTLTTGGPHGLSASTTDLAGNTGTAALTLTLDFAPNQPLFGMPMLDAATPESQVTALYEALLNRAPDFGAEASIVALRAGQVTVAGVASGLLGSAEYTARNGDFRAESDAGFVNELYAVVLGRAPDASAAGWVAQLAAGKGRGEVAATFALSGENLAPLAGTFVPDTAASAAARLYYELLGHPPDAAGLAGWTGQLKAGASLTSVAEGFLGSAEYAARSPGLSDAAYVEQLYVGGLGREADPGGLAAQLARLAAGTSRAELAADFANQPETLAHLAPVIEKGWVIA